MLRRHARARPGTATRGQAVVIVATALGLGALLNAQALLVTAHGLPFGWKRDLAVAAMDPVVDLSNALRLDVPRRELDRALGHEPAPPAPVFTPLPQPTLTLTPTPPPSGAPTTPPSRPAGPSPSATRIPTRSDPLRITVVGDSTARSPGQSLIRFAAATGVAHAVLDFRYGSGLSRPDFFDWPAHLAGVVAARPQPEVVLVWFGANDAQAIASSHGVLQFGTTAWDTEYAARVDAVMSLLTSRGARVLWVGQPIARSPSYSSRMARLDKIYARVAKTHPRVTYVDTWALFSTPDGHYSAYLRTDHGLTLVRQPDGIHLNPAGGDRLARVLLTTIEQEWAFGP